VLGAQVANCGSVKGCSVSGPILVSRSNSLLLYKLLYLGDTNCASTNKG
jgi:hypothetical protein